MTSVLTKIFEILLLNSLIPLFDEAGIPQATQTAYRKGVACFDSIFAGNEVISKFTLEGDLVFSCFYDLTSAFDTVEFCVLLEQLFHAGIKGKCWRMIKDWYKDLFTYVRIGSQLSKPFPVERGIRQGSVLSPVLFNLVMDPLLSEMKSRKLGLSVNGLYLGAFAHADDIRTASTNGYTDASDQVKTVDLFAKKNGLQLSLEKCGIVITGSKDHPNLTTLAGLPVENSVKCLGVWWSSNGSSHKSIEERINKARGAFFAHGQLYGQLGALHGQLNPLTSRSLIESCVMPVLMYRSEFWHLNITLLSRLECFQAELGKESCDYQGLQLTASP